MHPILFEIPLPGGRSFAIAMYGAMLALGTIAGVFVAMRLARKDGLTGELVIDLGFWSVLTGILGAKIWYVAQFWHTIDDKWDLLRDFRSGLVFYGGLVGATLGVVLFVRAKKLPLLKILDVLAPAGALGLAFGRIGCLMNGCCFGEPTSSWLGVHFAEGSPAYMTHGGVLVVPTQVFSSLGALAVFGLLLFMRRFRKYYGEQLALLFIFYPISRFTVEFFRGDNYPVFAGLSIPQVFSAACFVIALACLAFLRKLRPAGLSLASDKSRKEHATKRAGKG